MRTFAPMNDKVNVKEMNFEQLFKQISPEEISDKY